MHHRTELQAEFEHVASHIERMWRRLTEGTLGGATPASRPLEPPVDVYETDGSVVLVVEMAGLRDQQVRLDVSGRRVLIQGERRGEACEPGSRVYSQMEIRCGPFRRLVVLPAPVDAERARASYDDGFLSITFPKLPEAEERSVRIQVRRTELRRTSLE
ncbi:MAG TPA: Hsp20/alpha crystallin family protein [Dehalococcoidia bacterium]